MRKPRPITVSQAGRKGGKARLKTMTPEQRSEIARKAAAVRWKKVRELAELKRNILDKALCSALSSELGVPVSPRQPSWNAIDPLKEKA